MSKIKFEYRITFLYLIIGIIWIIFSDKVLGLLIEDVKQITEIQTYKGWFYVLTTAIILFVFIKKHLSRLRNTQIKLSKSEEKFKAFVENANDIIYQLIPDGVFTYVSPNWTEILGYQIDEVIGEKIDKFVHPDDLHLCINFLKNVLSSGEKQSGVEYRVKHKNGTWRWHNSNGAPIKDENDIIIYYIGVARDVTEQKIAQQKLMLSEIKYKAAFQTSPDSVNINKLNGEYVEINQGFTRLTGFTEEDVIGKLSSEIDIWSIPADREKLVAGLKKDGIVENLESLFCTKNGTLVPGLMSAKIIQLNNEPYILSVTRDITDRKNFENQIVNQKNEYEALNEELRQTNEELFSAKESVEKSEKRFKALIENAPDGVVVIDENGIIIYGSPNAARLFGYHEDEVIGHSGDEYTHPDDLAMVLKNIEAILKKPTLKPTINYRFKRKNGEFRWIETTFTNLLSDKAVNGIILNFTDITERKQVLEDLVIAKRKAEQANRLKTEFLNNMSHEIRTPMNGIIGFSDMLVAPDLSQEKREYYSGIVQNSSHQLLRIIDDILEISTLETRQEKLNETEFCLNDLLTELFSIVNLKSKERNIPLYLKKEMSDEQSHIISDKTRLHKILSNLLENALKFTDKGFVEFGYFLEEPNLVIYVKDTGIGISPKNHLLIFERFSQGGKEISSKHGGLGLGLSICKENAQLLGGEISLDSEKGQGSTFYLRIPYKPVQVKNDSNPANPANPAKNLRKNDHYTILIAEDEEYNFMYIEALFEDEFDGDYNLIRAKNGKEAVDLCLENGNIDLALIDIKMPILNGYEATEKIKKVYPDLPVIAQTAYSSESDRALALKHGCDAFISKPMAKEALFELINKYLNIK